MDDTNPFASLKKMKFPKKRGKKPEPKPAEPVTPPPPADDDSLFLSAMSGVSRLEGGGRDVARHRSPAPVVMERDPELEAQDSLRKLVDGSIDFELELTDEYMQGAVKGLDERTLRKLKAGVIAVEAHLDLHGMTLDQAYDSILFFLKESYLMGRRNVLLIHGRGKGSPLGIGILKQEIQYWLTREPLRRVVLAFCTALPKHGGAGALYVLLRKSRKTQGKVQFERTGFFGEDL